MQGLFGSRALSNMPVIFLGCKVEVTHGCAGGMMAD